MNLSPIKGGEQHKIDEVLNQPHNKLQKPILKDGKTVGSGKRPSAPNTGQAVSQPQDDAVVKPKKYRRPGDDTGEGEKDLTLSEQITKKITERREEQLGSGEQSESTLNFDFHDAGRIKTSTDKTFATNKARVNVLRSDFEQTGVKGFAKKDRLAKKTLDVMEERKYLNDRVITRKEYLDTLKKMRDQGDMSKKDFKRIVGASGAKRK